MRVRPYWLRACPYGLKSSPAIAKGWDTMATGEGLSAEGAAWANGYSAPTSYTHGKCHLEGEAASYGEDGSHSHIC